MKTLTGRRKFLIYVVLCVYLFLFIYYPPILSVNMLHVTALFAWAYLAVCYETTFRILNIRYIDNIILLNLMLLFYRAILCLAYGTNLNSQVYNHLSWIVDVIPVGIAVSIALVRYQISIRKFFHVLFVMCNLQGAFALLAYFNDGFHKWFLNKYIAYGYDAARFTSISKTRLDGLAMHLTNIAPLISAILIVAAFYLAQEDARFLLYIPLMLIEMILNSRTPLVIAAMGIVLVMLLSLKKPGKAFKYIVILILLIMLMVLVIRAMPADMLSQNTFDRIRRGFVELFQLIEGRNPRYFQYFFSRGVWRMPENLLFGVGEYVYTGNNSYNMQSDLGFVNYVWMGGIIYFAAIFAYIFYVMSPLLKDRKLKYLYYFMVISILVLNIKDTMFLQNEFNNLLFVVSIAVAVKQHLAPQEGREGLVFAKSNLYFTV